MSDNYDDYYNDRGQTDDSSEPAQLQPEGTYRARATAWGLGPTSGDNVQLALTFKLLDYPGKQITYYGSFSEAALEWTIKAMRTCGWSGVDVSDLQGLDSNEVSLRIVHEPYKGKIYAKVKWVNQAGGVALKKQLDPESTKAFAARMRGAIAAADAKLGQPQSRASGGTTSGQANRSTAAGGYDDGPPPRDDRDAPPPRSTRQQSQLGGNGFDARRDPNNPDHW